VARSESRHMRIMRSPKRIMVVRGRSRDTPRAAPTLLERERRVRDDGRSSEPRLRQRGERPPELPERPCELPERPRELPEHSSKLPERIDRPRSALVGWVLALEKHLWRPGKALTSLATASEPSDEERHGAENRKERRR
jgi:hypothetical protein